MGRIKTQQVKTVTHKLMEEHREEFTTEFGQNKALVTKFADVPSKKIRNTIAGYATRIKKSEG
ncbi:MAG: 30S ribosomal protein S17e [Nanoarchaeota archaeon]|nr:30S ribosomal protein S17e [Nanoarchaeota archaeon]MBU1854638.1 30S ribosomal protein S17e [Nanoarchaeota archaeon]